MIEKLLMSGEKVYQDEFYVIYDYPSDAKFAETLDYLPD